MYRNFSRHLAADSVRVFSCQVNADDTVAILAEVTSSLEDGATAEWALTEGVLDGYDDLSLAAASSLQYAASSRMSYPWSTTRAIFRHIRWSRDDSIAQ